MGERIVRALFAALLLAWPARRRGSHGSAATDTALRLVGEARERGPMAGLVELTAEAVSLVRSGLRLRREDIVSKTKGWTMGWMGDTRFALRTLRRSPGFAGAAVITLALGIGANAAVYSLVDAILLRPPPYDHPEELVVVWSSLPGSRERVPVAGPDAAVVAARSRALTEVAFTIRGVDGALGMAPQLGRTFEASDGPSGISTEGDAAPPAVVLADDAWHSIFAADPGVVGREIRVNGFPATVIGVMPPAFTLALAPGAGVVTDVDAWVPLQVPLTSFHRNDGRLLDQDSDNTGVVVARLTPGSTLGDAQKEADRIAAELRTEVPTYAEAGLGFDVRPLGSDATEHARPVLLALLGGVALVLLVACLNVATLLLARGAARGRELAIRASLGADRRRLVRQLLVESGMLAGLGLVGAVLLGTAAVRGLAILAPASLAPAGGLALDSRAVGIAAVLAVAAVLAFGLAPAFSPLQSGSERAALAEGSPSAGARRRSRRALVAGEVALSAVLVLCTGLFLRTVSALGDVDPGFQADGALTFRVSLRTPDRYRSPAYRAEVMHRIRADLGDLPGVRSVGLVGVLPLEGDRWTQPYGLPGQSRSEWGSSRADFRVVTSGAFEALGTRVLRGRGFTAREDLYEDERVVVVDEKLAARIAPNGSALGAVIGIPLDGSAVDARVVGVVEHIRYDHLDADGREAVYVPYRQEASRDVAFVVRTEGDPASLAAAVRSTVRRVDPAIPVFDLITLRDYVDRSVAPRRFAFALLLVFAALALLCVAVGLYGVVAFDVTRRTRDIGLRMAIGASRPRVVGGVLASGLRLGAVGLGVGILLGGLVGRALEGMLYGVAVGDPLVWCGVIAVVAAVTLVACWLPALRASRLDPTLALRTE
jgi:putative ABC transport system permease protein